jgi:hypothetical protein
MRKKKQPCVNGSECRSPVSTMRIFKHVTRWGKCINVLGDYVEIQ